MTTEIHPTYLTDAQVVGSYAGKEIVISSAQAAQMLLAATGGDTNPDLTPYVPTFIPDVATVCVGSYISYSETVKLNPAELDDYHSTHSRIVVLLHDKQRALKELTKLFGELGYIDTPEESVSSIHQYYTANANMLWAQRHAQLAAPVTDTDLTPETLYDLPDINRAMMEAIAARYICAASVKFLSDAQKFYEIVLETCTDTKQHFKCYRVYLADLDICAVYDSAGKFIDFCTPYDQDRQSLNANLFAGYRNPA